MEKIGVVTPTRGDRPDLIKQCIKYIGYQTLQPDFLQIVDYKPKDNKKDLVQRVQYGVNKCLDADCDLIFFIEDDDYYSPSYIFSMYVRWKEVGTPQMLGINTSIYYHLKTKRYWETTHNNHSSLMCTMITKELAKKIEFGRVKDIFLDVHLWKNHKGVTTSFKHPICCGIKHGIGVSGGIGHNPNASIYNQSDPDGSYLKGIVGIYNKKFYDGLL